MTARGKGNKMKITKTLLKTLIKEELLKEFYSEKDFDPKLPRNRKWAASGAKVTWNRGFIEEPIPGKFIMHTVDGKRVPKLDANGEPIPKTRTLRDAGSGSVLEIIPAPGNVLGIAIIMDDATGREVEVEIAELVKA